MTITQYVLTDLGWSAHFMMQLDEDELATLTPARLTVVHRASLEALSEKGPIKLTTRSQESTGDFTVGDWVLADRDGQIVRRLERLSSLERRAAGTDFQSQNIAANLDVLFITSSCNKDFNLSRLERFLILARSAGIQPVVLLTKADLCDEPRAYETKAQTLDPTLPVLFLDGRRREEVEPLFDWWRPGQTAALIGSSGVGKTTLLNTLSGEEHLTREIREDDAHGRHTTTARGLFRIGANRWLIDTPGMRALRLYDVTEGVEAVFEDLIKLAAGCRFSDCHHESEPGCAIREAIATGDLDEDRLKRWRKLEREDRHNSESIADARRRSRDWGRRARTRIAEQKTMKGR